MRGEAPGPCALRCLRQGNGRTRVLPFEVGQDITFQLGDRQFWGKITQINANFAEITVPVQLDLGESRAQVTWPTGAAQAVDLSATSHFTHLILRMPLQQIPTEQAGTPPAMPPADDLVLPQLQAEMRRSIRIPFEADIRLTDPQTKLSFEGKTYDLSGGGAKLSSTQALVIGREYLVSLPLEGFTEPIRAKVLRRLAHQLYAVKFLTEKDTGHRLMRAIFARIRGAETAPRARSMNFRKG